MTDQYATAEESAAVMRQPTQDEQWLYQQLDRIDIDRHEMGSAGDTPALVKLVFELRDQLQAMEAVKDGAYLERNKVVAALAKCFPSGRGRTAIEGWSDDWQGCVFIDLPTGQASWHFHASQMHLLDGLPEHQGTWDGHTTEVKYQRLADLPTQWDVTQRPLRMSPDILTYSGQYFDFMEPGTVEIETIAHALAHICRFTGHVRDFYSVAQHSVLVSYLVSPENALAALLHDAAEALIGDVAAPLKQLLPDYAAIEARVDAALLTSFGLPTTLPDEVKRADLIMLATERRDLMPDHPSKWDCLDGIDPMLATIKPMGPKSAKIWFLQRYYELVETAQ